MRDKTVVVIPGMIALPPPGVLRQSAAHGPRVKSLLDEIDQTGAQFQVPPVSGYLTGAESAASPTTPEAHYLALMAVSLALFESFTAAGGEPYAIVGLSIGELWALVAAGALSVADGARIACLNSRALTWQGWPSAMMAVGAGFEAVEHLVRAVGEPTLVVACINSPRQTVVSGPRKTVELAQRLAEHLGWATTLLQLPHPSHSPALAPAATRLATLAAGLPHTPPRWRVHSPTLRRWVTEHDSPAEMTAVQMTLPVHFHEAVTRLYAAGAQTFLECGASNILMNMIKMSLPSTRIINALSFSGQAER
ncbi:acyltransferase domain-containing protein [Catenulispora pinisilvae]|uniref:acyltransferase domain-containing protein n=1 Tax=Catenulispora pinisilvae TaxID=2705253 RepID=UPI0018920BEB|nr:acyltransferase domain-containing protein [Catenulispora pinisilvae]